MKGRKDKGHCAVCGASTPYYRHFCKKHWNRLSVDQRVALQEGYHRSDLKLRKALKRVLKELNL